mmetsp:Transcript_16365/g.51429  ORF Transcript_16365/g.51429 Transcript_16365/m.51429 type:complete len:309 (-) Transcript_16365:219-1145(-)
MGVTRANAASSFVGKEWFLSYWTELSMSADNLFAYYMVFYFFSVRIEAQDGVLGWGLLLSMVLRGAMIGAGPQLLQLMQYGLLPFALALVGCGVKLAQGRDMADDEEAGEGGIDPGIDKDAPGGMALACLGWVACLLPVSTSYDGVRFVSTVDGRFTPLVAALLAVEVTDAFFAVDSIPEVYAVSQDPFLVYTSNVFAIAALRALYVVVAHGCAEIPTMRRAVGVILVLEAARVLGDVVGVQVSTSTSMAVVAIVLGAGIVLGVGTGGRKPRRGGSDTEAKPPAAPDRGLPQDDVPCIVAVEDKPSQD